jgi:hypothetical protein
VTGHLVATAGAQQNPSSVPGSNLRLLFAYPRVPALPCGYPRTATDAARLIVKLELDAAKPLAHTPIVQS